MAKKIEYTFYKGSDFIVFDGEWYIVKYLSFIEMMKFSNKLWYKLFSRGYTVNETIFIRKNIVIGKEKLILHEVGHILGYKHCKFPGIMFPSWIGRWFRRWSKNDSL